MASEDVAPANWPPSRDEAVKMVAAVLRPGEERCAVVRQLERKNTETAGH